MSNIGAVFEKAIVAYANRQKPLALPISAEFYKIEDTFGDFHSYWRSTVWADRFEESFANGILYRPSITDEITSRIDKCFEDPIRGLMIKGPQGIGKSHSIVNVYRKLVTSRNYLVTFFPYCFYWKNLDYFVETICQSLNLSLDDIGMQMVGIDSQLTMDRAINIINLVASLLEKHGLKWVFIFDQVNTLFKWYPTANGLEELPDPYNLVSKVLTPNKVTCVIAASANNEIAYKESHKNFSEYDHTPFLDQIELPIFVERLLLNETLPPAQGEAQKAESSAPNEALSPTQDKAENVGAGGDVEEMDVESDGNAELSVYVEQARNNSGGVPLYVSRYLKKPASFSGDVQAEVHYSLGLLKKRPDWRSILDSIICALLLVPTRSHLYDRKYCIMTENEDSRFVYRILFPSVTGAYRYLVWEELMKYVEEKEEQLLGVCGEPSISNDTRGRIFEHMAIRRMRSRETLVTLDSGVTFSTSTDSIVEFSGNKFPSGFPRRNAAWLMIPSNLNFPAIDWIWVVGSAIYGVQCHVSSHDDVFGRFVVEARKANWFTLFDTVELVYFSPEQATTASVSGLVTPAVQEIELEKRLRNSAAPKKVSIKRSAIFSSSLSSLDDLQWPIGCSLPGPKKTTA